MVDASLASDYLYNDFCRDAEGIVRRMVGATVLTEDGVNGGRFKRRSCQFVSAAGSKIVPHLFTLVLESIILFEISLV